MERRTFLKGSGQAALLSWLAPRGGWSLMNPGLNQQQQDIHWPKLIADLKKLIPQLMQEAVVPGLSIALVGDGKLRWRQGFGVKNAETKEVVDNDTVFEAASVSKTVFAYFALKQCEKGIIGLDTPLSEYVPIPVLTADPQVNLITQRHVLSHTTGFQNIRSQDAPLKTHFKPGSQFTYSGEGYWYLQSVITHLMGSENSSECGQYEADLSVCATDIDALLKDNLLSPFGMKNSGYVWDESFIRKAANPHDVTGKASAKRQPNATDTARYAAMGGLHTTATDYARFLIEVLDPKPADAFRLTKKSHDEMLHPQIRLKAGEKIDDADAWALGWAVQQRKSGDVILHSGGQSGFRSLTMGSVSHKSGFVMLANSDNGGKVIFHPQLAVLLNPLLAS